MNAIFISTGYLALIVYIVFIVKKYGVLPSLSQSYYELKERRWFIATILAVISGYMLADDKTLLMRIAAAMLILVIAAPAFNKKWQGIIHNIGAYASGILSIAAIVAGYHFYVLASAWVVVCITMIILAKYKKLNNLIWWIEMATFATNLIAEAWYYYGIYFN